MIITLLLRTASIQSDAGLFVLLLSLSLLGVSAGFIGGLSRESAVATIIPAVLGIAGGLATYLFGVDRTKGATASIGVIAFTTALFFGFGIGSSIRGANDSNAEFRKACFNLFFDPATYESREKLQLAYGEKNQLHNMCRGFWGTQG